MSESFVEAWPEVEHKPEASQDAIPWYPERVPGYGEWVEGIPPTDEGRCQVLMFRERENRRFNPTAGGDTCWLARMSATYVAAHAMAEAAEPTSEQVEKCEPVTHLTPDEKADANEPMVERDFRPMSPRELLHHARRLPPEDKASETQEGPDGLLIDAAGASERRLFVWGL